MGRDKISVDPSWSQGIPLVAADQMRMLDGMAMEGCDIPGIILMERAGGIAAAMAFRVLGYERGKKVLVLCGKGNNGGDGFVLARFLWEKGVDVKVSLSGPTHSIQGDAAKHLHMLRSSTEVEVEAWGDSVDGAANRCDLIVDALLGTGITGPVQGRLASMIEWINRQGVPILSLDLPSGANADSGRLEGPVVRASQTITFGLGKRCFVMEPCAEFCGEVWVGDIGLPRRILDSEGHGWPRMMLEAEVASWLPAMIPRGHKGNRGRVLVVGGSRGMTGAPVLAGEASLRSGAGMAMIAGPEGVIGGAVAHRPELMWVPLSETSNGSIGMKALDLVRERLSWADVAVLGPGASRFEETAQMFRLLISEGETPFIVDADGLSAWEGHVHLLSQHKGPLILTPHPGEFARLWGVNLDVLQSDRIEMAKMAALKWNCIMVLKGANTVVADQQGRCLVSPFVHAGLATAGSGDVLAGILGGLIGRFCRTGMTSLSLFEMACLGVWIHGVCGTMLYRGTSCSGYCAGDLLHCLGKALDRVTRHKEEVLPTLRPDLRKLFDVGGMEFGYE